MTIGLQVSDDGFDGGAAAQLALDGTEDVALLARDEDPSGILCVVAAAFVIDATRRSRKRQSSVRS
ncbi:hypothetical protein ACVWY3_004918 [Bradyrhizobium sp. USDA 4486]